MPKTQIEPIVEFLVKIYSANPPDAWQFFRQGIRQGKTRDEILQLTNHVVSIAIDKKTGNKYPPEIEKTDFLQPGGIDG